MNVNTIPLSYFTAWLANGERGISSEAIVSNLTGEQVGRRSWSSTHPHDPDDFRRCQLLLRAHPLAAISFPKVMRTVSPEWARLVDAWDDIHTAIEAEAPGYLDDPDGSAPNGYRLMKAAIYPQDTEAP